ncbi:MAG: TRAP transporter substrate-binding protein DctP [Geminicoccaceae bacterium]|jgi:tripartite ATP-independent transporter DctP family solute receptor|nr:TRAP transporter substrate-binding protein DctP [Geminicoccaceae bacterium]HRY24003.1 TRAP transporter substrate-binding protein DctP [Geminicoccaceae bacterium]
MTKKLACGLLAAALLAGTALPTNAAEYVLKYGHPGPVGPDSDDHVAGEFLKYFLETQSNGRIEVQIFPGSQLGSFREMVEQVNANTLEVAHTALGGLVGFMPELQVIELPYVVRDDAVAECMIQGPFFEDMRETFMAKSGNVNLIGVGNTGRFRSFFTANKLVKSAEDLKGIKMRVINSQLPVEMMQFYGANPTPIAWGELYTSLATGVVEGTKNAVTDIIPNKMEEVVRYATMDQHAYLWGFMAVSQDFLDSLPDDLRAMVVSGVRQMADVQLEFNKGAEARQSKVFTDGGGEIYVPNEEEMATFRAVKEPMGEWYKAQFGDEWLNKFTSAATECEEEVDLQLAKWGSRE